MNLLQPLALLGALALIPLLFAFMSRRHVRHQHVSSLLLLRALETEQASRRRSAKLKHVVAFLLCLLALAALVIGLTDPREVGHEARGLILVVDTSASMGALEGTASQTRLERAVEGLDDVLDGQREQDWTALITAGPRSALRVRPTHDTARVRDALEALAPLGVGGDTTDAMRLVRALCAHNPRARVLFVSDGTHALTGEAEDCESVESFFVGEPADNLALTALTVREADALGLSEVFFEVLNAGPSSREVRVDLYVGSVVVESVELTVEPGTRRGHLLRRELPEGDILRAHIPDDDALTQDNEAFVALSARAPARVLYIGDGPNRYLEDALELHPRVELEQVEPALLGSVSDATFDLVIATAGFDPELLPATTRVVGFGAPPETFDLRFDGPPVTRPAVHRWDFEHPLLRYVNLDGLHIQRAGLLVTPDHARPIIETTRGALALTGLWRGAELVYFSFPPQASDLVLRVAFVNLVANLIEWARPTPRDDLRARLRVGQRLPAPEEGLKLAALTGEELSLPISEPVPRPGVFLVEDAAGEPLQLVAVNLFSPSESQLSPLDTQALAAARTPEPAGDTFNPWRLLLFGALAFLALEWLLPGVVRAWRRRTQARRDALVLDQLGGPPPPEADHA